MDERINFISWKRKNKQRVKVKYIESVIELNFNGAIYIKSELLHFASDRVLAHILVIDFSSEPKQYHWSNAYGDDNAFPGKLWRHLPRFYAMSTRSDEKIIRRILPQSLWWRKRKKKKYLHGELYLKKRETNIHPDKIIDQN